MKFSVFPVPKNPEIAIREPTDLLAMLPPLQSIPDESGAAVRIPAPQGLSIYRGFLPSTIRSAALQIKIKQILTIHDRYPTNRVGRCQEPELTDEKGGILMVRLVQVLHFQNLDLSVCRCCSPRTCKERIERFPISSHQREYPLTMGVRG